MHPVKPSKLRPAPLPANALQRPQLLHRLTDASERGCLMTLLSAPLGYGKSTLLAQYAAQLATPWAWLRCDAGDNHALTLLLHLGHALDVTLPERPLMPADEGPLWARILQQLESFDGRFTLLFDDLHQLRNRRACALLDELLHFAPAGLRIVAASQGLPQLALGHLRRAERLCLLGENELALDTVETGLLVAARDLQLGSDAIYQLRAGSEGWISGVLFGLSAFRELMAPAGQELAPLRPVALRTFGYIADFLDEELLRELPAGLLDFIERTSLVKAFDPGLAACLSGRPDAVELIRQMQRRELFIQQRPGERLGWRYHPALRRTLYQRLRQRDPAGLQQLHRQAAAWLLEQRCYTEAVYQLGRAQDFDALLAVIEQHSFDLLREGQVNSIVDFLSDVSVSDHFTLAITDASTVIVTNDIPRARACLLRLQRLLRRPDLPGRPERVHQTLAFVRSSVACLGGNLAHGIRVVDSALERFPQTNAATAVLHFNRASCLFGLGRLHAAREHAGRAVDELETLGFSGYTNSLHLLLGRIELARGEADNAAARFLALDQPLPSSAPRNFYDTFHNLGQGLALLQQNRLEQAAQRLSQAEAIAVVFPHCAGLPWVFHFQACLYSAMGNLQQARARWDEARRIARQYQLFALYRLAGAWRARLAVRERDQDFILGWLQEWHWCRRQYGAELQPAEWLAYAWVQRHLGQHKAAEQIAGNLREQAEAEDNRLLLLDVLLLETALLQDRHAASEALARLDQALQLASAHGLGQLAQHEGRDMAELFRQLLSPQVRRQAGLEQPLPPREQLNRLLHGLLANGPGESQQLLEPLTRREQDVLQRMARGQGNQQIADGLYISLSTVKTHINNLFRKLDASDREGALQAARTLNLLD
ncbi:LuxR C-terminal-related transcriptional regulator [Pseudomonas jinjuensis]|uniref:LuxR family transcriptional regulator, maltose regulon positive regulatory protein n=1 Tax=Pseudomonas jinjuensis TaxID=198616 RepID=A0A1G9ZAA3_9PSED|nr:LuxR C-terminal-related transcriptional regulator [Pseudomonas jinjuensis]SDN17761.1 LuxR family transcriptional regulator, maltose regulon positive regulatory protein [Pseudomonas jinjuensis]